MIQNYNQKLMWGILKLKVENLVTVSKLSPCDPFISNQQLEPAIYHNVLLLCKPIPSTYNTTFYKLNFNSVEENFFMEFTFDNSYIILEIVPSTVIFWTEPSCWHKSYSNKNTLLLTVYYILFCIHSILFSAYSILIFVYFTLFTIYFILFWVAPPYYHMFTPHYSVFIP